MAAIVALLAILVAALSPTAYGFYLPGIAPVTYEEGASLSVYAHRLTSAKNQLPYAYFWLPFCRSTQMTLKQQHLNFGEILQGERDELTDYSFNMNVSETCKRYCSKDFTAGEVSKLIKLIDDDYLVQLTVDNMPIVMNRSAVSIEEGFASNKYVVGIPLGMSQGNNRDYVLFNHLTFHVKIHRPQLSYQDLSSYSSGTSLFRVVGFEAQPRSVKHEVDGEQLKTCPLRDNVPVLKLNSDPKGQQLHFTYDVLFEPSELRWATRWDPLLQSSEESRSIQWFYYGNSLAITFFLTVLVAMILTRTVYLDFARYNNLDAEDMETESGWKQVYGDVFRPPMQSEALAVFVGNGVQIAVIVVITLGFALLGFWSPAYRGGLLTALIFLWVLTSCISGYTSARLYTAMNGTNKRSVTLGAAFFFSGALFSVFFTLNLVLSTAQSSAAVPFFTLLALLTLWLLVSVPLSMLGSLVGYRAQPIEFPCKTNHIPREIPESLYCSTHWLALLSGSLPFGVVFVELVFLLDSIWQNDVFTMFGFLFAVFVLLVITCAEVSMVAAYLLLTKEDYRWWWTSFLSAGSSGLYVWGYSLLFVLSQSDLRGMHASSAALYIGYTTLIAVGFLLMTGAVGFLAALTFVRRMFRAVRID